MQVQELHLQVNQRLQEVASSKRDKYFPEEIDMALNKAMFRLLERGVDSRFQNDQINLGHVAALIKKNRIQEIIKPAVTDKMYEENVPSVYTVIPPDFYWLVDARAEMITDPLDCSIAPALAMTTISESVAVVPFPAANASPPYYPGVAVSSSILGTLYTAPAPISTGFNSTTSKYVIINNILEDLYRHTTVKAYWERYRDVYYKDSFIFVAPSSLGTVTISGTGLTSSIVASTITTYPTYNRTLISSLASKEVKIVPVKTTQENLLYSSLKQNQFYDTSEEEVVMDQTFDYFLLYTKESFILSRFYMDYIRKPRTISLVLNQSCELADSTHPKIVDLAVELLRLDTKDQTYPATAQDIQLRTN